MKRKLFLFFLLAICALGGFAQGWNDRMWTGIQGPVLSASTKTEVMNFTNEGFYNYVQINYAWFKLETWDLNHTEGAIYGSCYIDGYEDSYTMHIDGGRLSSISVGEYDDYNIEFSYNTLGQPTQVVMTEEHEGAMVCILKYSNYKTDEFGNWISRSVSERQETYDWWSGNGKAKVKTKNYTETRSLTYTEGFCEWNNAWPSVKRQGNLAKIAEYGRSALSTSNVRSEATEYWNSHVVDYVKANNMLADKMLEWAYNPMNSTSNSAKILSMAREKIYNEQVMSETDFAKVMSYVTKQYANCDIFDDDYKQRIRKRSDELRQKKIADMETALAGYMDRGEYSKALTECNKIFTLESGNRRANDACNEANYKLLLAKSDFTTTFEHECKAYLNKFPNSPYCTAVGDLLMERVLSRAEGYTHSDVVALLEKYASISMSASVRERFDKKYDKARKKVNAQAERAVKRKKRGPFCGFTVGFNLGGAHSEWLAGAEAGLRFGFYTQFLNLWVGAKYELSSGYMDCTEEELPAGYLSCNTLNLPVVLRMNLWRGNRQSFFMGLGAEYTKPLKARYATVNPDDPLKYNKAEKTKDNAGEAFWAPRVSFGYSGNHMEVELFGTYNLDDKYNASNLQHQGVPGLIGPRFQRQIDSKLNIGIAWRFGF